MDMLCKNIGARPTGSVKNKIAVDYVSEVLQTYDLQVNRQEFDCIDWHNYGAALLIDGQNVPVMSAEYSLPCDVEAEFICVNTVDKLQRANLADKIAVLYGNLCKEPLMPKNFEFYNPDEHKQIIALLEEKNPQAIITTNPSCHKESIIQDGDFNIPCATVDEKHLETFFRKPCQKAKLTLNTERIPTKAHNVIATYGTNQETVCFSAHIDTKPNTPGALDNASGVSTLLTLADIITKKEYPFQIEFALLNGEDYYSTPGEKIYLNNLYPKKYKTAINIDGIGLKNSLTSISFYEYPKHLEADIMKLVEKQGSIERIEPWPMGDHMIYASHKIPTIALTAANIFNILNTTLHTPKDDLKNIDMKILDNAVQFLLTCIKEGM
jgi:aminopeptidase YwaD